MTFTDDEPYEYGELIEMRAEDFNDAATDDFDRTIGEGSAFLHPDIILRTYHALNLALTRVDTNLLTKAEDPNVTAASYRSSVMFRKRTLYALTVLEGHPNWPRQMDKGQRYWRAFAHQLADAIEGTAVDRLLDEIAVPGLDMTTRQWVARRRVKDPNRVPNKELVAA